MEISLHIGKDAEGKLGAFLYIDGRGFPGAIRASTLAGLLSDASRRDELKGIEAVLPTIDMTKSIGL